VYPHSFKEEFSNGFCCDILLTDHHNGHLRESVDDHKNIVIAILSRRKARNVIRRDGFPRSIGGRKRSIEALLLDGQFGNGASHAGLDVLPDILSKVEPIEILLQYCHSFLDPEMPNKPTVVRLPNHLGTLA
jgi:hypothetical protein